MEDQEIAALCDAQATRTSLDQAFYTDNDIYQRDIEEVYLKSWLWDVTTWKFMTWYLQTIKP